jgi:predicted methyltransferase
MTAPKNALLCVLTLLLGPGQALAAPQDETDQALIAALAGDQRSAEHRARDAYRHPRETLNFFGLRDHMTVVELWPGGGWYTEVLAPALRGSGQLVAAHYGDKTGSEYRTRSFENFVAKTAARPDVYGQVKILAYLPTDTAALGQDGTADMVVTFRNIHSLIRQDGETAFFKAAYRVLKPGGVLGIVQHRAAEGADPKTSADRGYVPQSYVIELAEAAGFRLAGTSEINANPKDTKNYAEGVWTLPPALRLGDKDRAKYLAIGESDRMTLRFVKPAG